MVIFLFIMYAQLTIGNVKLAVSVILPGGDLAALFWFGVVLVGLLIPALIELYYVVPKLLYHRGFSAPRIVDIAVSGAVLLGGFLLRYVVVVAGQVTGPVGI
ncbi:MAG: NrfD/PsrC family molybdoenzyme membrane anchor subunit, partial [Kiloniellales bacterium]